MTDWLRDYALLALRVHKRLTGSAAGSLLIYRGPGQWRAQVEREEPPPAARLVDDADALLDQPFPADRAAYLTAQARALRAAARRLTGAELPLAEEARESLGMSTGWLPEEVLEEAHARLDRALPRGPAPLAERLRAWQAAHTLPPERLGLLPALVDRAVADTRRRTGAIVELPAAEVVRCRLVAGAPFRAAGEYEGGLRSTIHLNRDLPFNLADLLTVVAHEGHPGHIAESLLKQRVLVEGRGRREHEIRFLLTPSFVLSEGLGLHAEDIAFPGDQAQAWLHDNVLREQGIAPDGSDFAEVHRVQNVLFGAWANAAFLVADGRADAEVAAYLSRWALLTETDSVGAVATLRAAGMGIYVLGYYHGWRLLGAWLDAPDRFDRVRRLLTEPLLPADLVPAP